MPLTRDDVRWSYKVLLDREPENSEIVDQMMAGFHDMKSLKAMFFSSDEFLVRNKNILKRLPMTVPAPVEPYKIDNRSFIDLLDLEDFAPARGIYEKAEIAFMVKRLREGYVFVDVGGGRGIFSVIAASCVGPHGRVLTIESDPRCASLIEKNATDNGLRQHIEIVRAVVTGQATGGNNESLAVLDSNAATPRTSVDAATNDTLDNILKGSRQINFMRLELHGAEVLALEGARHILSQDRPLILSSVDPDRLEQISNKNWQYYFGLMSEYGYKAHILDEEGLGKTHPHLEPGRVYSVVFSTTGHYIG